MTNTELLTRKGPPPVSERADDDTVEARRGDIAAALEIQESKRKEAERIRDEGTLAVGKALAQAKMDGVPMREIERASGLKRARIAVLIDLWRRSPNGGAGS